jgi:hypothetical protein
VDAPATPRAGGTPDIEDAKQAGAAEEVSERKRAERRQKRRMRLSLEDDDLDRLTNAERSDAESDEVAPPAARPAQVLVGLKHDAA